MLKIKELAVRNVNNMKKDRFSVNFPNGTAGEKVKISYSNIRKNDPGYKVRTRDPLITK